MELHGELQVPALGALQVDGDGALVQLRAFIARSDLSPLDRLPPERELCETLGVTRNELRKALTILEAEGTVTRHVGRGTFIAEGERPAEHGIGAIAKRTSPRAVMRARFLIEPVIAEEAAEMATQEQVENLIATNAQARAAGSWREYETLDNQFHRQIAEAAGNVALLAMFDQLNALRRTVVWGRLRSDRPAPGPDHHSFAQHAAILGALSDRDGALARKAMQSHLSSVADRLFSNAD
ncbi:MAG: FCD domain-containing protein [Pseudomonadota bacterium]